MARMPRRKWRNENALCLSGVACLFSAFCAKEGSGMRTNNRTKKTTAKIAKAIKSAGVASLIFALVASPINAPPSIVTAVAENEFKTPPN